VKKFSVSVLILVLALSCLAGTAFGKEDIEKERILVNKQEEKDLNKLYKKAVNGESDINPTELKEDLDISITNEADNKEEKVDVDVTAELTKKVVKEDGTIVESYTVTAFTDISESIGIMSSGSNRTDAWDSSGGVKGWSQYNYDKQVKGDYTYQDLQSVSGGWSVADSSITISSREVLYGATGPRMSDGSYVTQRQRMYPTGNSFSYTAPSKWEPVRITHAVGVTSYAYLARGGSKWTFTITNQNAGG
jgi:hypothetical protein